MLVDRDKPERWLRVEFHPSPFKTWRMIYDAFSDFEFNASHFPIAALIVKQEDADSWTLIIEMHVRDRDVTGRWIKTYEQRSCLLALSPCLPMLDLLREAIHDVITHEIDESIYVSKRRVFDPHVEPGERK